MIVEDDDEEAGKKEEREKARIQEMVAAETQRERQRMEAENQRLREEMERREAELQEKERKKRKRNIIVCIVIVVLLIGGGVAAFFALQGGSSSDVVNQNTDQGDETLDPAENSSTFPSLNPTDTPSNAPTDAQLKYDPPSREECERIAAGLSIDGEDAMFARSFDISMEVDLVDDGNDIDTLVPELETKIEKLLVPDLIGCPRDVFATQQRRGLGHYQTANNAKMSMSAHRQLQALQIRYAIAKAVVTVTVTDGACEKSSSPNCSVVSVNLDLKVREDEKIFLLETVLALVFPQGVDIRPDLQLKAPFDRIVVVIILSLDPTAAPSMTPTGIASENPTSFPSSSPSTSPTSAPVSGPTPAPVVGPPPPTTSPSMAPSQVPSLPPTLAPTPTPPPTFAPLPGLTPPPTPPPTKFPTVSPSKSPSGSPSSIPSLAPSRSPSDTPSFQPSVSPSKAPSTPEPTSTYLGCFKDTEDRVMDVMVGEGFDVQGCKDMCKDMGYPYSAIQYGHQCLCSNNNGYDSLGTSNDCNVPCGNPDDDHCGGVYANSVYLSGAPLTSVVPALESDLYCGCFRDHSGLVPVLEHKAPHSEDISQRACIQYCKSKNYAFAGLQWLTQCFCGDSADDLGISQNCFFLDKDQDGNPDGCKISGPTACLDNSEFCECGGSDANTVFRTSTTVSCPAENPPPTNILACKKDQEDRDFELLAKLASTPSECMNLCKEIGYVYSAMQEGQYCFCGNSYGRYPTASGQCGQECVYDPNQSGCGGDLANSVYYTGAEFYNYVSELEENLYCGCTRDIVSSRDLEHTAPYINLGQKACILYCRSKGYDFAGLQIIEQCFCGNNPGTHSFSESCDMGCWGQEAANCYDDSSSCTYNCGGRNANQLFRTSTDVSCPSVTSESYTYLGCFRDAENRVLDIFAHRLSTQTPENCARICRDMGFAYSAVQVGEECFCGNQYDSLGTADNCNNFYCTDGSECGGPWANSVYATGLTTSVATLEDGLYCGCRSDGDNNNRDLEHNAPYLNLSQKGCIHYCKAKNYAFAGLQFVDECWCGNSPDVQHGPSYRCNTVDKDNDGNRDVCLATTAFACYFPLASCSCGGVSANTMFRTSTSASCPEGDLISKDLAVAEWNAGSTTNGVQVPELAIDGNTSGEYSGVAEILGSPTDPYWQVNLGFKATVKKVIVWNRTDCCSGLMLWLELQLVDGMGTIMERRLISIGENDSNDPASQTFEFSGGVQNVVYVRIQRHGINTLNIAEVQVFS